MQMEESKAQEPEVMDLESEEEEKAEAQSENPSDDHVEESVQDSLKSTKPVEAVFEPVVN